MQLIAEDSKCCSDGIVFGHHNGNCCRYDLLGDHNRRTTRMWHWKKEPADTASRGGGGSKTAGHVTGGQDHIQGS